MYKKIIFITLIFALFFGKSYLALDPDFGWHLRMGQIIRASGIPKTDVFSFSMPQFPFIDHEWLADVYLSLLYPVVGMEGLALLAAGIGVITLLGSLFLFSRQTVSLKSMIFLLLAASVYIEFIGIRPQILTWLFLVALFHLLFYHQRWRFRQWLIPPLFLLWANLHGGFAIGMAVLVVVAVLRMIRLRRISYSLLAVVVLSFAATLINPYGLRLWVVILFHLTDSRQRWTIAEWQPAFFQVDPAFLFFVTLSCMGVWYERKKLPLEVLGIFPLFLLGAISALRHIPLWLLLAVPVTLLVLRQFEKQIGTDALAVTRLKTMYRIAGIIMVLFALAQCAYLFVRIIDYQETLFYPQYAAQYLRTYYPRERLFAPYNWGGYLIWRAPQEKLFIDGRMPTWHWPDHPPGQSADAFGEYLDIYSGKTSMVDLTNRWEIHTVLWYAGGESTSQRKNKTQERIEKWWNHLIGEKDEQLYPSLLQQLQAAHWRIIYQDQTAVILRK